MIDGSMDRWFAPVIKSNHFFHLCGLSTCPADAVGAVPVAEEVGIAAITRAR
ncbi:hypothetical protein KIN20_028312 [Parelaphostrongylus tenuis]|uniref:Uncharacterized protein n=1 Tax=Parelaphostrongylus tenuis TaxID=148309 RepID=A0AAD5R0Z5_PARTN|nr:hypothetical protein KIN20_028312 [Parelaphostrongylus tenuis]